MASRAIFGCGFVKQDGFPLDFTLERVALRAADVGVPALQREFGALIVIEGRGDPALDRVTFRAQCHPAFGGKLLSMRVVVACFAILGSPFELRLMRTRDRLVAIPARHPAMSSLQWEFRFRMVEAPHIDPGSRIMTSLAA